MSLSSLREGESVNVRPYVVNEALAWGACARLTWFRIYNF